MMLSPSSPPRAQPSSTPAPGAPASTGTTPANSPRLAFLASCLARARGAHHDDDEDSFISTDLTSDLSSAATDDDDLDVRSRSLRADDDVDGEEEEEAPYWSHSGIDAYVRSTGAAMALDDEDEGMLTAAVEAGDAREYRDALVADTVDGGDVGRGMADDKYGMEDDVERNTDLYEKTLIKEDGIAVEDVEPDPAASHDAMDAVAVDGHTGEDAVAVDGHTGEDAVAVDGFTDEDATTDDTMSDDALDPEAMADDDDALGLADLRSFKDDSDCALADWAPYGTDSTGTAPLDEFCAHPPVPAPDGVAPDPNTHKHDLPTFLLSPYFPTTHLDDTDDDSDASDDGTTAHDRALPLPLHPMGSRGPGRCHASWPLPAPPPAISTTVPRHVRFASGPRGASPRAHARRTASAPVALPPRQVVELIAAAAAHDPTAAPGVYLSPLAGPRVAPVVLDGAWRLDHAVPGMGMASSESDPGSGSDADGWAEAAVPTLGGSRSDDEDPGTVTSADDDDDGEDDGGLNPETRADPVETISSPSPRATSWSAAASGTASRRRSRTTSSASSSSTLPPYSATRSRPASPPRATLRFAAAAWFPDGLITAARVRTALRPPTTSTPSGLRPVIPIPRLLATLVAVATVAAVTVARVLAAAARSGAPVAWSTPTADRVLRLAAPFASRVPMRLRRMVSVDGPKAQAIVAVAVAVLDGAVAWGWAVDEEEGERVEKAVLLGAAAW
ncbi:hypothetical protein GGF32_002664 [Allomyces javanicus]|nr:hypothetical protein GGF32_002664 [Allomyces javanicus]